MKISNWKTIDEIAFIISSTFLVFSLIGLVASSFPNSLLFLLTGGIGSVGYYFSIESKINNNH